MIAFRTLTRQTRLTEAVFDGIECDFDFVAYLNFNFALFVAKLTCGDYCFGFEAGTDYDNLGRNFNDAASKNCSWLDLLTRNTLLKQLGKTFQTCTQPPYGGPTNIRFRNFTANTVL